MKALSFPPRHAAIALTASLLLLPLLTGQSAPKRIDWAGDLRFFEAELPKAHVDAFHSLKRDQFHRMVSTLIASAPHSTDRQVVAGLMRITSAIGDSHSGIHSIPANLRFAIVPISVYLFGDQLGIVAGAPYCQDLIGGKIIFINGHPVKEVVQHMKLLTEGTNDMTRSAFVVTRLIRPELLFYEGLAERPDQYDLVVEKDGKTIARSLTVLGREPDGSPITGGLSINPLPLQGSDWVSAAPSKLPLWLENMDKQFCFAELPDKSALYIQDRLVLDEKDGQSLAAFYQEVFKKIEQGRYKTIVLDIRLNGGGDNTLFEPLKASFTSMPAFQNKGQFFVIIGRLTQSAAENFTTFLERNTKAIFVGEPTGESPNHYGDPDLLELPSSGISINLSRKRWNDSVPGDHRPWTQAAIPAPLTLDDFRKGCDPALEAIWKKYHAASDGRLSCRH
jgi:Peptidase family S41